MDEEIKAFLAALNGSQAKPLWASEPGVLRARPSLMQTLLGEAPPLPRFEDIDIPVGDGTVLRARLYGTGRMQAAVIVYLHGGGWVMGSVQGFHPFTAMLARDTACAVLSIDYRLAPEHPFPAPLQDATTALAWASRHLDDILAHRTGKLFVMGDSAGANLATVAARLHQQSDVPRKLDGQVLVYPVVDSELDTESARTFAQGYFLSAEDMRWFWTQYAPDPADRGSPLTSPLRATLEDLRCLPDTLLATAQFDILRDAGFAYGMRLREAKVPVSIIQASGQIHGFLAFVTRAPGAHHAYRRIVDWIQKKSEEKTTC